MSVNSDSIPFEAYKGELPYIFVSYCHGDSKIVFPEMKRLHHAGYRIWYDEGISPTKEWSEEIASALETSAIFIFFVSPRAINSNSCRDEAYFALDIKKIFLAIYLEDTELPKGLKLRTNRIQAIFKHKLAAEIYERKVEKFLDSLDLRTLERHDQSAEVVEPSVVKDAVVTANESSRPSTQRSKSLFTPIVLITSLVVGTALTTFIWSKELGSVFSTGNRNVKAKMNTNANVGDTGSGGDTGPGASGPGAGNVSASTSLPAVHLPPSGSRNSRENRDSPLAEADRPTRTGATAVAKAISLTGIIHWLDVEHSKRYGAEGGQTFSNIYAYDYCYLAGVYLPRVWWTPMAIAQLTQGKAVQATKFATVSELNSQSQCTWLDRYGSMFKWKRATDVDELQRAADEGKVALICGYKRVGKRTHIALVVPQTNPGQLKFENGKVTSPVQSYAGDRNFEYSVLNWWDQSGFIISFWINE